MTHTTAESGMSLRSPAQHVLRASPSPMHHALKPAPAPQWQHESNMVSMVKATAWSAIAQVCVAVCCSVLQCRWQKRLPAVLSHRSVLQCVAVCFRLLQCIAVRCRVFSFVAVYCRALPCGAVCCRVLPYVAVGCRVLQCVAMSMAKVTTLSAIT